MGDPNLAQLVVALPVKAITMTDMMQSKFCFTHAPMASP
jgi:hypothetical protein